VEAQLDASVGERDLELAQAELHRLGEMLGSMDQTLHELCAGEVPHILIEHDLRSAIEASANIARTTGTAVNVRFDTADELPLDVVTAVYFCCVEAIQNALKHAHASAIAVNVRSSSTFVDFDVTDNGSGFDPTLVDSHSGLEHMTMRLSAVGATVAVESALNHGTRISGHVPLVATS
jgi:signal transduction histidine kinase